MRGLPGPENGDPVGRHGGGDVREREGSVEASEDPVGDEGNGAGGRDDDQSTMVP